MISNVSLPLFINNGVGQLQFPEVFNRGPLHVKIGCSSLYFNPNVKANNEPCFLVSSGSFYYTPNREVRPNILCMFQNKKTTNTVSFSGMFPVTSAQENMEIEIVDFHYKRMNVSCLAILHLEGSVKNKHLTI